MDGRMKYNRMSNRIFLVCLMLTGSIKAMASEVVREGREVFRKCEACHVVDKDVHIFGPSLAKVFKRDAGSLEDFNYSKAMRAADWAWSEDNLRKFLSAPAKNMVPGTNMVFSGITNQKQLEALIAYLKTL